MIPLYQLRGVSSADDPRTHQIARVFHDARVERLQFLIDLHTMEEDRAYLAQHVLPVHQVWVAEADSAIVGFIAFGEGWVHHLYFDPRYQRQGLGGRLLDVAKRSGETLQLWVFQANAPAIEFYQRHGFHVALRTDGQSNEARQPDALMAWHAKLPNLVEDR